MSYQSSSDSALRRSSGMIGRLVTSSGRLADAGRSFLPAISALSKSGAAVPIDTYVGQAAADTQSSFENAKGQMERNLSRMGVNPNSGRFAALQQNWARALAAATTGAKTRARQQGSEINFDRTARVAGFGAQMLGMGNSAAMQAANLGLNVSGAYGGLAHEKAAWDEYSKQSVDPIQAGIDESLNMFLPTQDAGQRRAAPMRTRSGRLTPVGKQVVDRELDRYFGEGDLDGLRPGVA